MIFVLPPLDLKQHDSTFVYFPLNSTCQPSCHHVVTSDDPQLKLDDFVYPVPDVWTISLNSWISLTMIYHEPRASFGQTTHPSNESDINFLCLLYDILAFNFLFIHHLTLVHSTYTRSLFFLIWRVIMMTKMLFTRVSLNFVTMFIVFFATFETLFTGAVCLHSLTIYVPGPDFSQQFCAFSAGNSVRPLAGILVTAIFCMFVRYFFSQC